MTADLPVSPDPKPVGLFRRTFQRHRFRFLCVWLLATAVACGWIYEMVLPPYEAFSVLRVEPPSATLYGVNTSLETFDMFLKTQTELLTSPNVLEAAGKEPRTAKLARVVAAEDVIQELKKAINVSVSPGTYLIRVSMTSPDPKECATIVNAVVDAYLNTNEEWSDGVTRKQIKNLENYQQELHTKTEDLERQWKALVARGDVDSRLVERLEKERERDVRSENRVEPPITLDQFKRLDDEIFDLHANLVQAEAWLSQLKAGSGKVAVMDPDRIEKAIAKRFQNDPEAISLASELLKAQEKLAEVSRNTKDPEEPNTKTARKKLETLQDRYNTLWLTKSEAYREEIELAVESDTNKRRAEAESKVRELQVKEAALKELAEKSRLPRGRQMSDDVDIRVIQDERTSIKALQEAVQRRLEQLNYESRGETRVRRVSLASMPTKPISDIRPLLLTIAPFAMILVVLPFFLGFEAFYRPKFRPNVVRLAGLNTMAVPRT